MVSLHIMTRQTQLYSATHIMTITRKENQSYPATPSRRKHGKRRSLLQDGNIPLFLAVEVGNHGVCRDLLGAMTKEQVNYIHPSTGNTALHLATKRKDLDIMRFLVECNSPINHQNVRDRTFRIFVSSSLPERLPSIPMSRMVCTKRNIGVA